MSYLAILGRQPGLSLAELESVLGAESIQPFGQHALLTKAPDLSKLGGTIKLAEVIYESKTLDAASLDAICDKLIRPESGKLTLGLSLYGSKASDPLKVGMELKKRLRQAGPVRLVLPKRPQSALSAAQLKFNRLNKDNPELILASWGGQLVAAVTLAYQDVDAYSDRDYGRPGRDTKVGMLPPKLAQILINLSGTSTGLVFDPFCGSGVVLQEARLMGRPAAGSDIDARMIKAAKLNQEWLDKQPNGPLPSWHVTLADATTVAIPPETKAIVSEGYLGPTFHRSLRSADIKRANQAVSPLVQQFLKHLASITPAALPVVMCLPAWKLDNDIRFPSVIDELSRLGYTTKQFVHTSDQELTYMRPGQLVGRKILVMRR